MKKLYLCLAGDLPSRNTSVIRSYITQPLSGIILDFEDTDHGSEEIFMANTFNDSISFNELPDFTE